MEQLNSSTTELYRRLRAVLWTLIEQPADDGSGTAEAADLLVRIVRERFFSERPFDFQLFREHLDATYQLIFSQLMIQVKKCQKKAIKTKRFLFVQLPAGARPRRSQTDALRTEILNRAYQLMTSAQQQQVGFARPPEPVYQEPEEEDEDELVTPFSDLTLQPPSASSWYNYVQPQQTTPPPPSMSPCSQAPPTYARSSGQQQPNQPVGTEDGSRWANSFIQPLKPAPRARVPTPEPSQQVPEADDDDDDRAAQAEEEEETDLLSIDVPASIRRNLHRLLAHHQEPIRQEWIDEIAQQLVDWNTSALRKPPGVRQAIGPVPILSGVISSYDDFMGATVRDVPAAAPNEYTRRIGDLILNQAAWILIRMGALPFVAIAVPSKHFWERPENVQFHQSIHLNVCPALGGCLTRYWCDLMDAVAEQAAHGALSDDMWQRLVEALVQLTQARIQDTTRHQTPPTKDALAALSRFALDALVAFFGYPGLGLTEESCRKLDQMRDIARQACERAIAQLKPPSRARGC